MKIQIKNTIGKVIFETEADSLKHAVSVAIRQKADLRSADLRSANLSYTNLSYTDLNFANLRFANLSYTNLRSADLSYTNLSSADLSSADLRFAKLRFADLSSADLRSANLRFADLRFADLSSADLRFAKLRFADLRFADLRFTNGVLPELICNLMIMRDQPGTMIAYKLVNEKLEGIYKGGFAYSDGKEIEVKDANTDPDELCGAGINVATLDWILREYKDGMIVKMVSFTAKDIAAIPTATDGKFRLHRCKVEGTKDISGLVKKMRGKK